MSRFPALLLLLLPGLTAAFEAPRTREPPGYEPVTAERIAVLPEAERRPWQEYLERSQRLAAADLAVLADERANTTGSTAPASGDAPQRLARPRPDAWYADEEARELAERVISYQTPAGGWNKSNPYTRRRPPGEDFGREHRYRGTFDNGATVSELRFLARVISALPENERAPLVASFEKGLRYIFAAQYPNGGWPQVYPLTGGYHDAVTFNDDAMVNVLALLRDIAAGREPFAFVNDGLRSSAELGLARGHACLLRAQVVRDGTPVAWGQQHDALTLLPCAARAYEMASLCTAESAGIVRHLLSIPSPSPELVAAVGHAAAWFERTAIADMDYRQVDGGGRSLVPAPGAGPWWARMVDMDTDRPLFGDRDYTVHPTLATISEERRRGYAWYTDRPAGVLRELARWRDRQDSSSQEKRAP